ncbi:MAG: cyclic nucleotide-binding domain-containing protein [Acholeplasmatales bacterium]|nr:cyclic nucleotide-binding domain-containing protein [Acholeplasmatales bacterium]
MDLFNILRKFPLLEKISDAELNALIGLLKQENFTKGKNIITEGEKGNVMYILIDGVVDVIKTTIYKDEFICATLDSTKHCIFGEMALLDEDKRSATVKAKTDCKTVSINKDNFEKFIDSYPKAGIELLKLMSINLIRNIRTENNNLKLVYQALIEEIESN